jgi:hypothetical protein
VSDAHTSHSAGKGAVAQPTRVFREPPSSTRIVPPVEIVLQPGGGIEVGQALPDYLTPTVLQR